MRFFKVTVCALLLLSTVIFSVGCTEEGYPVTVGKTTFEESPETVAILSPNIADIVDCIGYSAKVALVSEDVKNTNLQYVVDCGTAVDPDVDAIANSQVKVVFADDNISDGAVKRLEEKEIKVVQFHYGNDNEAIKSTYKSVGSILGGKEGGKKGEKAFDKLLSTLATYRDAVSEKCRNKSLMYLSGTSLYTTVVKDSWYNTLLDYTGVKVLSDGASDPVVNISDVAKQNPDYLVYEGKTLDTLKDKKDFKNAKFLKKGNNLKLPKSLLKLQGTTAVENLKKILNIVDKKAIAKAEQQLKENKGEAVATTTEVTTVTETTVTTTVKKDTYELQSKYKVKFTDKAIKDMVKEKENDYIKAMQQRFKDLGYVDDDSVTGYFGDITEKAISDFQKKNGMKETGKASKELLIKLFSSEAKKAK